MRYICLVAIVLSLPLTASAQQRRAADRRSDTNHSVQRGPGERRADDGRSAGRGFDERRSHPQRPPSATTLPWWERQPAPWWEGKQRPTWEKNRNPPGWESGNVARALLDRQRLQQQRAEQQRHNQLPYQGIHRRSRYYAPSMVYVLPAYGGYFSESISTTSQYAETTSGPTASVTSPLEPPLPMGALRLEVEPRESLQIFVDGVYVGRPVDLGDQIEVAAGTRRIELRAPGYRTLTFTAEITDGRSITYRGTLEAVAAPPGRSDAPAAPIVPPAATGSRVMYVIPGCYLGNVSPKTVALPAGCDISKLTTISR